MLKNTKGPVKEKSTKSNLAAINRSFAPQKTQARPESTGSANTNAEKPAVIIDNGSGTCKCGLSSEYAPKSVIPTVVGRRKPNTEVVIGVNDKDAYVGFEAKQKRKMMNLRYPIDHGVVRDWDDMEKLWSHCFYNELKVKPEEYRVMLTEIPLNSKQDRERMAQIMFEKLRVPSLYIGVTAVLALYASARTIGIVIDSGDGITHAVPIFEGYALPHAILKMELAGADLTEHLMKLLSERPGNVLPKKKSERYEAVKLLKEKFCTVAQDYETALNEAQTSNNSEKEYTLPDGSKIVMGNERFKCPESLFQPSMVGLSDVQGLHDTTYHAINKCDADIRRELFSNIVLSGGTTMFENIDKRLKKEVESMAPKNVDVFVVAPPERKYSVWIGGSILASLFGKKHWVDKEEWNDEGESMIHRKCF